jgi:tRNA-specific 2-thiouridylase
VPATVTPLEGKRLHVEFDVPQRAVTPGQAAVVYIGDEVVGGGTIERRAS